MDLYSKKLMKFSKKMGFKWDSKCKIKFSKPGNSMWKSSLKHWSKLISLIFLNRNLCATYMFTNFTISDRVLKAAA